MVAALGLFSIGLIVGGLAPSMPILVGGRVLQGLGAGVIPPIGYVAIGRAFPDELRPRMFAVLSTAWVLPGLVGPALAGAIAEATTWRLVFLGLLPLILVAAAITLPALSRVAGPDEARSPGSAAVGAPADRTAPAAGRQTRGVDSGWRSWSSPGPALVVGGLTSASLVPGLPFVVVGVALILPAFRRLTPPGTLRALPRPARGGPAARHPDLHLLRRGRLRPARPPGLAWPRARRRRSGPDRRDPVVDGRRLDPGPQGRRLGRRAGSSGRAS